MFGAGVDSATAMVAVVDKGAERAFGGRVGGKEGEKGEGNGEGERDGSDEVGIRSVGGEGGEEGGETFLVGGGSGVESDLGRHSERLADGVKPIGEDEEAIGEVADRGAIVAGSGKVHD